MGGSSHFCIITIVQLFLPTSSLYITAGKSWYYYPLQKRNFPLYGGIFETLPLNYNFLVMQYWNSTFFCNKRHPWSLPATHFFWCNIVFCFSTRCYLSNVPAPASRVSQVPVSMYSLPLSLSFCISLTLFFRH